MRGRIYPRVRAGRPIPKSHPWSALSYEEGRDLMRLNKIGEDNWLRRDRHRFRELHAKMDKWVAKQADSD